MKAKKNGLVVQNKVFGLIGAATAFFLLIPLVMMQFSTVNWGPLDFVAAGVLIFGSCSMFVLAARKVDKQYWPVIGIVLGLVVAYIWAELAVGIFTTWGS